MKIFRKVDPIFVAIMIVALISTLVFTLLIFSGSRGEDISPKTKESEIVNMCQTYSFKGINKLGVETTFQTIDPNRMANCIKQAGFTLKEK